MPRILIIEDDPDIAQSVKYSIEREDGFSARVALDGEVGLEDATRHPPDLVLLDLNLPGMDGLEVCRALRKGKPTSTVPVIMLTARVDERDRVAGLDIGADDYVIKPFSTKELISRIRAVLRRARTPHETPQILSSGDLVIDESNRTAARGEEPIRLTRKEFDLLAELLRRPGLVWTREQLLERVWGYEHPGPTRTIDVHVRQLRKKLGAEAAAKIETVVGVGYRFREPSG